MEHEIIGALVMLGLGILKGWRHYSAVQEAAHAIVQDEANPINNPRDAIVQVLIQANQKRIDRMVDELEARQADAKRDTEAAYQRGKKLSEGMQIEVLDPHANDK